MTGQKTGRRHVVRDGDGYLRRDGTTGTTYEVWAVEDGTEWCVEADIRGHRNARAIAKRWRALVAQARANACPPVTHAAK